MADMLTKTKALRAEALATALASIKDTPAFAILAALDEAVRAMGGELLLAASAARADTVDRASFPPSDEVLRGVVHRITAKRLTQTEGAAAALRENGAPLPSGLLMEAAGKLGVRLGGADPLANFRTSLSKDGRFISLRRNSMSFWWFKDEPVPLSFQNETGDPDLRTESPASLDL